MAISQIPALAAHISYLLWQLNIWQTSSWHIPHLSNGNFIDSCSILRVHIWWTKMVGNLPPFKWQFNRFLRLTAHISSLLWDLNIWQDRAWQISPLSNGSFTHSCSILRVHIWQTKCWEIYPPFKWQFHRFMPYWLELIFGRWGLGRSIFIPRLLNIWQIPDLGRSYPILTQDGSKFGRLDSWTSDLLQMAISQIPALL